MKRGYLINIIPPTGDAIHRLEVRRWHVLTAIAAVVGVVAILGAIYVARMDWAGSRVQQLRAATDSQAEELGRINKQAQALGAELERIQRQNQQIRGLMGADRPHIAAPSNAKTHIDRHAMRPASVKDVADRLTRLQSVSERVRRDDDDLRGLALRVLNVRHMEEVARARLIAAIPSINPVPGTSIASAFGWRSDPWPEFHKGVDLDANYGDRVLAAAAGTVVSSDWDGGFGLKVDIDHGNGYHTWYAHLSRADVKAGDYVRKAQPIALVGATGEATGPHLHYQVLFEGQIVDPTPFLHGVPEKVLASLH